MAMQISQAGVNFIKSYEGLRLTAYDAGENDGILTIGYGHRDPSLKIGDTITEAEAETLLKSDLSKFVGAVDTVISDNVFQHQFDALVSFAFNLGTGIFTPSSSKYDSALVNAVNSSDIATVSYNLAAYRSSVGKVLEGLVARRNDEIELFITGDYQRDSDFEDRLEKGYYISTNTTISGASIPTVLGVSDIDEALELLLVSQLGRTITDVKYSGSPDALYFVSNFAVDGVFNLSRGLFLSTGGLPSSSNTSSSYSISHGVAGDADLLNTAKAAFSGAGTTQDASVLEFKVNNKANSAIDGISFDIIFGSDEYPEYSNTSFVDVAAIYVNGVNVALFNNNPTTPLSVIQQNVTSGNFINNTSGTYATEWDGFSNVLTIRAPLKEGENTIKIGIADTGDMNYDSGLYVNNIEFLTQGATGGGVLNVINGDDGNNTILPTPKKEEINLFKGADIISGTPSELNGDIITGFSTNDTLVFNGSLFSINNVNITYGSAILDIDTDQNGDVDTTVTLEGKFEELEFNVNQVAGNTEITVSDKIPLSIITGTGNSDYLVGTDDVDIIYSLGGNYDRSFGGLGADIFAFGSEALNGIRERDVIMDYEVGIDSILLEDGASVGSVRQTSTGAVIFLEGDTDAIYVQGQGVLPDNLTFLPESLLLT